MCLRSHYLVTQSTGKTQQPVIGTAEVASLHRVHISIPRPVPREKGDSQSHEAKVELSVPLQRTPLSYLVALQCTSARGILLQTNRGSKERDKKHVHSTGRHPGKRLIQVHRASCVSLRGIS